MTQKHTSPAIEKIAEISIPEKILSHRFVVEVRDKLKHLISIDSPTIDLVLGTENTKTPELYGWANNIPPHVDDKGFCYILILESGCKSKLMAGDDLELNLLPGDIICLNDFVSHSAVQEGFSVALFVGAFDVPCHQEAVNLLRASLRQLEDSEYYNAPRYHNRDIQSDECFVLTETPREDLKFFKNDDVGLCTKLIKDALNDGDIIEKCQHEKCNNNAFHIDPYYPYFSDETKCKEHF